MQNSPFATAKYLNLESVRRNGQGVRTPVWFAMAMNGQLYAYASADATIIPAERQDFAMAMRLLDRKYFPWKQILGLANRLFARKPRAMIEMRITGS